MKIRIGKGFKYSSVVTCRVISVQKIISVQLIEDGKGVSGNPVGAAGMAAVGGLLFGGSGAVAGAIVGQNLSKKVSDVSLAITIDDLTSPLEMINFLPEPQDRNTIIYKTAIEDAYKWMNRICVLISRRDNAIEKK